VPSEKSNYRGEDLPLIDCKSLIELIEERCQRFSVLPALSVADRTVTFAELDRLSRNFAAHLQTLEGLQVGDRVAVMMNNSIEYAAAAFGVLRAGMVLVNTNPMYTSNELLHQFEDSGAKVLVTESGHGDKLSSIIRSTEIQYSYIKKATEGQGLDPSINDLKTFDLTGVLDCDGAYSRPEIHSQSLAMLQYTGGTTGRSKGAMLSHGNLLANSFQSWQALEGVREAREIPVVPLPLYHIYAFSWSLLVFFMHGSHVLLIADPRQTDSIVEVMERFPFTCFFGLNSLFISLLHHPKFSSVNFKALHITLSGGAPLPVDTALQWEKMTGCEVHEGYGLTEASPVVCVSTPHVRKLGTVGKPVPGTELKLVDKDGNDCLPGQEGELCIRGPQIMQGYWRQEQETKAVLSGDGWLRTGDIASIDDDGFVRIVDRKKDLIIVSGFNVYPAEIEQVVSHHPDVIECAAVGVFDEKSGQAVKLFVVPRNSDLGMSELQSYCRERLAAYKVPKQIVFADTLPKSAVGKILRRELK
jgi:long-chain acyl-CoA synthetase